MPRWTAWSWPGSLLPLAGSASEIYMSGEGEAEAVQRDMRDQRDSAFCGSRSAWRAELKVREFLDGAAPPGARARNGQPGKKAAGATGRKDRVIQSAGSGALARSRSLGRRLPAPYS